LEGRLNEKGYVTKRDVSGRESKTNLYELHYLGFRRDRLIRRIAVPSV
jgi:hypothetical protein